MAQTEPGSGWSTAITARRVMVVAALFIIGYFSLSIVSNAVTQAQLEKLVFAQTQGELYLGLRNDSSEVEPGPGVNADNLFND